METRKSLAKWIILITLIIALLASAMYYFFSEKKQIRYTGFGINIPVNYFIHGIDVSHYQSDIDWEDVKAMQIKEIKIGFCFIKATDGIGRVDNKFSDNWYAAKEYNMVRGAYHFFDPAEDGVLQAKNFVQNVQLKKGDLPPVLDVEQLNGETIINLQQRVHDWMIIAQNYYHVKPIIYTNVGFYERCLAGKFDDYPLWVAHYLIKDKPRIKRNWLFWQHNEAGHVNGIDAYVDFNVFNGDSTAFKNLLIK